MTYSSERMSELWSALQWCSGFSPKTGSPLSAKLFCPPRKDSALEATSEQLTSDNKLVEKYMVKNEA